MGFHYHTEFNLGRFGGRGTRTYTGARAALAIAIDLAVSLVFSVFSFAFWVFQLIVKSLTRIVEFTLRFGVAVGIAVFRVLAALIEAPYRAVRAVAARRPSPRAAKPSWAGADEL
jgi:hypothetical protein